jgi:ubiquitin-protein ligase
LPDVSNVKQAISPLQPSKENVRATSAIRTLMRDLKEIEKNPLPLVSALPLEDNMFIWHCNLKGPGTSFHS